ncbi:MAG: orotidine-5'-phosphate decarboxylase [Candidatus Dormibacteria bacterium]
MVGGAREPFRDRLAASASRLCVGIDPEPASLPPHLGVGVQAVRRFCLELIEATADQAGAFKPNTAFFEQMGHEGWELLREVVQAAGRRALVVVDAKRGDIGSTAAAYAHAIFDGLGADACTVNPYLGRDALSPFLDRPDRLAFVLCRTSNPGAADFQDLPVEGGDPLYIHVARAVSSWDKEPPAGTAGLVVGATWPKELGRVRAEAPGLPLLIPGVGAQGGDLEACVRELAGAAGSYLISVSRGVAAASSGPDFADAASRAAKALRQRITAAAQSSE